MIQDGTRYVFFFSFFLSSGRVIVKGEGRKEEQHDISSAGAFLHPTSSWVRARMEAEHLDIGSLKASLPRNLPDGLYVP